MARTSGSGGGSSGRGAGTVSSSSGESSGGTSGLAMIRRSKNTRARRGAVSGCSPTAASRAIRRATRPKKSAPVGAVSAAATTSVDISSAAAASAAARSASGRAWNSATRTSQPAPVITRQNECGSAERRESGAESGSFVGST